ncbi:MAG: hypothetical protein F4Y26_12600 [Gammaproteobacteria bacterium]|nr:hypothetical protein [Gammaproteobacteria bacterium]
MTKANLVPAPKHGAAIETSGLNQTLGQIRPEWQARNLIQRVKRILPVDPSSACQRLFNACIHDLREKVLVAGLDIAQEAAKQHKLPPLAKAEDLEEYSVRRTIDLAYRMGLLSRPEWRRLLRTYDIRKDLEHEDDEYEAEFQDCVYIFTTCIDIVLSQDPVQLIKLTDIKEIVEQPSPTTLTDAALEDFEHAPEPRQSEIYRFLIDHSLRPKQPDIVRQNCYNAILALRDITLRNVKLAAAESMVKRIGRKIPDRTEVRVSLAAGTLPYLKQSQLRGFFQHQYKEIKRTSYRWTSHGSHGELLRDVEEAGGLDHCPKELLDRYLEWLVMCYIGEPGGYGMGVNRRVFYSNVGAPIAYRILQNCAQPIGRRVEKLRKTSHAVKAACSNEFVASRFKEILNACDR